MCLLMLFAENETLTKISEIRVYMYNVYNGFNTTHKKAKRLAFSQQVITRLQGSQDGITKTNIKHK